MELRQCLGCVVSATGCPEGILGPVLRCCERVQEKEWRKEMVNVPSPKCRNNLYSVRLTSALFPGLLLLLLRSPAISLGFTILGEIFGYGTVF